MRNLKKVLVLVLCFAMILGIMVVGAGAAFSDQDSIDSKHTEAVDMCVALNIINGMPDGSFDPTGDVTREQMAKMICVLDNGGKEPQGSTGTTFSDVAADRWSNKFIESCAARGVVAGVGGGKFDPEGKVTGSQAAKMLLVELGYDQDIAKYTGAGWDTNVNIDATKNGYYNDLEDIDVSAPLSREHAAQMIWNALQANEVAYDYTLVTNPDGSISSVVTVSNKDKYGNELQTLLADKYGAVDDEYGILTGASYDSDKDEWTYTFTATDQDAFFAFGGRLTGVSGDYSELFGQQVKVIYTLKPNSERSVDKVLGIFAYESSVIAEGVIGDIDFADLDDKSIEIDGTDYKTTDKTVDLIPFNNYVKTEATAKTDYAQSEELGWTMKAIDNDDDGKIDVIVYLPFTVAQVDFLGTKSITTVNGDKRDTVNLEDITLEDGVAEDDYVMIIAAVNTVDDTPVYCKVDVDSGEISKVAGDDVTVNDNAYTVAAKFTPAIEVGDEYDLAVVNGYVYMAEKVSTDVDVSDYALITAIQDADSIDWDADNPKITLLLSDGTFVTAEYDAEESDEDLAIGMVVYIDDEDDNVYTLLTDLDANRITDSDYFAADNMYDKDSGKVTTTVDDQTTGTAAGKFTISDSAVIFTWNAEDKEGDVISGKDLKTYNSEAVLDVMVTEDSATGLKSMAFGFINAELATSSDLTYAYVVKAAADVKNADGDKVVELTLSDGTTVQTGKDDDVKALAKAIKKGTVIGYELTDGAIKDVEDLEIISVVGDNAAQEFEFAVTGTDGTIVQVNGIDYEITDDTQIIYVDSSDTGKAAEGGKLVKAQTLASGKAVLNVALYIADFDVDDTNDNGNYELDLIVIDINNNINDVALTVATGVTDQVAEG